MSNKEKSSNFMNEMIDAQTQVMDQVVESAKNLTKNVPFVSETLDKGHKLFQESVTKSKEWASDLNQKIEQTEKNMNTASNDAQKFFNQWFENQMTWAKNIFNNASGDATSGHNQDWMKAWNQYMSQQNNWFNQMNTYWNQFSQNNPWMHNNGTVQNPFAHMMQNFMNQQANEQMNQWLNQVKEYSKTMSAAYEDWAKQLNGISSRDAFKGLSGLQDHIGKFFELWAPLFKSINDKTFQSNRLFEMMNADKYKEFMDSFFKFMPEEHQKNIHQASEHFFNLMKNVNGNWGVAMNQFSKQMNSYMPQAGVNPYNNVWETYSTWKNAMNDAVSPLTKLMGNNQQVKEAQVWSELSDMMTAFQIKNSELQYMIYQNGVNVMNKLSEKISDKLSKGEQIESVVNLYKDWLMLGDETFTQLFNSDAYSKLMTEVSSLQMKIKQRVDQQMENTFFANLPLATRTELDEVYKNLYDLRKLYHNLERMIQGNGQFQEPVAESSAKKSSKK
ncbi:MAG: hypothetical protein K1X68_00560 [Saprospiraceae bacterium]|nr:hypothetical protein [Saprospiraceae bacterium]HMW37987.1 poly(R)-hydroxyalkanoic acid synthase subunit PhaE [Saprospiraceae bacterium]HMX87661.1 poly(R)-hydroxyalkanoic acid synthase subunit PhaE [Saprospiraceae bacterium]HMZ39476.1 poly(R)-hydroxyalkanoic acid synthase subunit PhaE [Saprospiraceae bacterium]HNA63262.1 poly(R)-hydroxyalkanoic acid synthase subunit PhaE [Saprospiraceae bacterium]